MIKYQRVLMLEYKDLDETTDVSEFDVSDFFINGNFSKHDFATSDLVLFNNKVGECLILKNRYGDVYKPPVKSSNWFKQVLKTLIAKVKRKPKRYNYPNSGDVLKTPVLDLTNVNKQPSALTCNKCGREIPALDPSLTAHPKGYLCMACFGQQAMPDMRGK